MKRARLFFAVILTTALALPALWAVASQNTAADRAARVRQIAFRDDDRRRDDDRDRHDDDDDRDDDDRDRHHDDDRDDDDEHEYDDDHDHEFFGRTIRLEFQLLEDEEQPTFVVLCAGGDFTIEHEAEERDVEHHLHISGELLPLDDDGDRVLIRFHAHQAEGNAEEGAKAEFAVKGSAVIEVGKSTELALLGDVPLSLTATDQE